MALAEEAPVGTGQRNSQYAAVIEPQSEGYPNPIGGIVLRVKIDMAFKAGKAGYGQPGVLDEALIEVDGISDGAQNGSVQEQFSGTGALFDTLHHGKLGGAVGPQRRNRL